MRRYKVIVANGSCHGGKFDWTPYLPKGKRPGKWTPRVKDAFPCSRGYHLTSSVVDWLKVGCEAYLAEGRWPVDPVFDEDDDGKRCFQSVRLIRRAPRVVPTWWRPVEEFVRSLDSVPWLSTQGSPKPEWNTFDSWAQATEAARQRHDLPVEDEFTALRRHAQSGNRLRAWRAAWYAARDVLDPFSRNGSTLRRLGVAADDVRNEASLMVCVVLCRGLPGGEKLDAYFSARWDVWCRGYGLAGSRDGVLYVYRKLV